MYVVTIQSKINQQILLRCVCEQEYELHDLLEEKTTETFIAVVEWLDTYTQLKVKDENRKQE